MPPQNTQTDPLTAELEHLRTLELEDAGAYLRGAEALAAAAALPEVPAFMRAQVLCELGNARRVAGRFDAARTALHEAVRTGNDLPPGLDRDTVLGQAYLRLAIISDVTGALVDGFDHIDHATAHFQAIADEAGLARCDIVRAALYMRLEDYGEAEACYRRALAHYRSTGEQERVGITLSNLVSVLRYQDRPQEAVDAGREALSLARSTVLRTAAAGNLAFALGDAGLLDEALELARSTEKDLAAIGGPQYDITYKRAVGTLLTQKGEGSAAVKLLSEALAQAEALGFQRDVTDCHGLLANAYAAMDDYRNAYVHQREYHLLSREQHRLNTENQLAVHKWRLKLEAAEQQAQQERTRRERLAESLDEAAHVNLQLSARAAELEWSSYRDALTELPNRRYFDQRLGDVVRRSRETGEDVALLILDLDRFKAINDTYGHPTGDATLRASAHILQSRIRRSDMAARMGGEEFAVLLTGDIQPGRLHGAADQLRQAFEAFDWTTVAPGLSATVSIGAARLSETDGNPLRLLELADQRLYEAKRAGRNRVVSGT